MKSLSKNKLLIVTLGLGFVCVIGYIISDISPREAERSLASKGFSFDKELSALASKRVIKEMQSGKELDLGSPPSELERFLFEDLKGEFSLEIEPNRAFKLTLLDGKNSSVLVENQLDFIKEALSFLFEDQKNFRLIEKTREPASSLSSDYEIVDDADEIQAEVVLMLTKDGKLKTLLAKTPK